MKDLIAHNPNAFSRDSSTDLLQIDWNDIFMSEFTTKSLSSICHEKFLKVETALNDSFDRIGHVDLNVIKTFQFEFRSYFPMNSRIDGVAYFDDKLQHLYDNFLAKSINPLTELSEVHDHFQAVWWDFRSWLHSQKVNKEFPQFTKGKFVYFRKTAIAMSASSTILDNFSRNLESNPKYYQFLIEKLNSMFTQFSSGLKDHGDYGDDIESDKADSYIRWEILSAHLYNILREAKTVLKFYGYISDEKDIPEAPDFKSYLTDQGVLCLPKLVQRYKGSRPKRLALMLTCLEKLKLLKGLVTEPNQEQLALDIDYTFEPAVKERPIDRRAFDHGFKLYKVEKLTTNSKIELEKEMKIISEMLF